MAANRQVPTKLMYPIPDTPTIGVAASRAITAKMKLSAATIKAI